MERKGGTVKMLANIFGKTAALGSIRKGILGLQEALQILKAKQNVVDFQ